MIKLRHICCANIVPIAFELLSKAISPTFAGSCSKLVLMEYIKGSQFDTLSQSQEL